MAASASSVGRTTVPHTGANQPSATPRTDQLRHQLQVSGHLNDPAIASLLTVIQGLEHDQARSREEIVRLNGTINYLEDIDDHECPIIRAVRRIFCPE